MPRISDERRAARRGQILDAAWTCFQRQGLHATTMDDIIRASGLSAGAVYSYFPSKEELIFAAVTTSLGAIGEEVAPILRQRPPLAPDALVRALAETVTRFTARDGYDLRRIALLGWAEAQRNERLRGVMREAYLGFRVGLAAVAGAWRAEGALGPDVAPEDVAKTLLATVLGFVVQSALLGDVEAEELADGLRALGGIERSGGG
ncbi:TetR/AcrR family transcriptional regulator [Amaricoccus sp.]|uniref:TetR/AcrR family transcriptional regulator n=1 Tax=Amaricoccus sp. TaxID=1872485 RepID=UPI001B573C11|nr:TetR/AcrR family transcriptional regulator [Amaricoccus sp.]MBP7002572.1 TetR/AcrR family transcriptional regulator [Amaricoccus sp.]